MTGEAQKPSDAETIALVIATTYSALHPCLSGCVSDGVSNGEKLRQILAVLLEADPLVRNRFRHIPETEDDRALADRHAAGQIVVAVKVSEDYLIAPCFSG